MARVALDAGLLIGATVYAEVIVRPLQQGTATTVDGFLDAAGVRLVAVDRAIARQAAELRAAHPSLRLPDAMSLATALVGDADLLTLDRKLQRISRQAHRDT